MGASPHAKGASTEDSATTTQGTPATSTDRTASSSMPEVPASTIARSVSGFISGLASRMAATRTSALTVWGTSASRSHSAC